LANLVPEAAGYIVAPCPASVVEHRLVERNQRAITKLRKFPGMLPIVVFQEPLDAKLPLDKGPISPHSWRHTAATWLMQRGTDPWQAAGFLGMSVKILIDTYGHHHPDYMKEAAEAITAKDRKSNVTVVETVVELRKLKEKREKSQ
jgi:integrase